MHRYDPQAQPRQAETMLVRNLCNGFSPAGHPSPPPPVQHAGGRVSTALQRISISSCTCCVVQAAIAPLQQGNRLLPYQWLKQPNPARCQHMVLWKRGDTSSTQTAVLLCGARAIGCPAYQRLRLGARAGMELPHCHIRCARPSLECTFTCSMLWAPTRAASNAGVHCLCMSGPADEAASAG